MSDKPRPSIVKLENELASHNRMRRLLSLVEDDFTANRIGEQSDICGALADLQNAISKARLENCRTEPMESVE